MRTRAPPLWRTVPVSHQRVSIPTFAYLRHGKVAQQKRSQNVATEKTRRIVNWDDVPDPRSTIPDQLVHAKIVKVTPKKSKDAQLFMIQVDFRITKGQYASAKGMPFTEFFCLGNEDDPNFTDPSTKTFGLSRLKKVIKKSGAKVVGDLDKQVKLLVGTTIGIDIEVKIDDGKKDPKYKGQERNNARDYFAVGERPITEKKGDKVMGKKKDEDAENEDENEESDEDEGDSDSDDEDEADEEDEE